MIGEETVERVHRSVTLLNASGVIERVPAGGGLPLPNDDTADQNENGSRVIGSDQRGSGSWRRTAWARASTKAAPS